jgi:hypothetical protein
MENDSRHASEYLTKFAKLMRLVLENSREQEIPMKTTLLHLNYTCNWNRFVLRMALNTVLK